MKYGILFHHKRKKNEHNQTCSIRMNAACIFTFASFAFGMILVSGQKETDIGHRHQVAEAATAPSKSVNGQRNQNKSQEFQVIHLFCSSVNTNTHSDDNNEFSFYFFISLFFFFCSFGCAIHFASSKELYITTRHKTITQRDFW